MYLSGDTAIISYLGDNYMGSGGVSIYSFDILEIGSCDEVNNPPPPPHMGGLMICLDLVWTYLATLLSLDPMRNMRGALIADMVMYTPRLMGSGLRISV